MDLLEWSSTCSQYMSCDVKKLITDDIAGSGPQDIGLQHCFPLPLALSIHPTRQCPISCILQIWFWAYHHYLYSCLLLLHLRDDSKGCPFGKFQTWGQRGGVLSEWCNPIFAGQNFQFKCIIYRPKMEGAGSTTLLLCTLCMMLFIMGSTSPIWWYIFTKALT